MNTKYIFHGSCINDIDHLSKILEIDSSDILLAVQLHDDARYTHRTILKKDGRERTVYNPKSIIRKIQNRIKNRLFTQVEWPIFIFGSIPSDQDGSSNDFIDCAQQHCMAQSLLKLDIEDFFDNITQSLVEDIFQKFFHFSKDVSEILANLCCVDFKVPQGGITSSYIASIALYSLEEKLFFRLKSKKLTYTRYVDDITISSKNRNFNFDSIINIVENLLNNINLPLNLNKIEVCRFSSTPLKVHNIRIDFKTPRYDKSEVKNIRAAVHRLEDLVKNPNYRTHYFYRIDFNRCQGLVSKLGRVGHASHSKLQNKLNRIKPLPNQGDIDFIKRSIEDLKKYFPAQKEEASFIYKKKFFKTQNRVGFLRSHPKNLYENTALILNKELQCYRVKPKNE